MLLPIERIAIVAMRSIFMYLAAGYLFLFDFGVGFLYLGFFALNSRKEERRQTAGKRCNGNSKNAFTAA